MNISDLQRVLTRLEEMYAAAGAAGQAKDLKAVVRMLDGHEAMTVDDYVSETSALLTASAKPASAKAADVVAARRHASALLDAGIDKAKFQAALADAESDTAIAKPEWIAIANQYLNEPSGGTHKYKFKSAREAQNTIRSTFAERFEAASKQGIIRRLTQWAS